MMVHHIFIRHKRQQSLYQPISTIQVLLIYTRNPCQTRQAHHMIKCIYTHHRTECQIHPDWWMQYKWTDEDSNHLYRMDEGLYVRSQGL